MSQEKTLRKILWAIDPFDGWSRQVLPMGEVLRDITRGRNVAIHPVSFFSLEEAAWYEYAANASRPLEPGDFRTSLERFIAELQLPGIREARVLSEKRVTPASFSKAILSMAERENADAIAVTTHGRTGIERWSQRSFAEKLLLTSPVPVLVLNPGLRSERQLGAVLIPTDFSRESRAAFETAVTIAAQRKVPAILLHETERFDTEAIDPAHAWAEWARARGVTVRVRLESRPLGKARAIVECAKAEEVGLIAMATKAGALRAAVGASIARTVVQEADCPVLVWHPRRTEEALPLPGHSAAH